MTKIQEFRDQSTEELRAKSRDLEIERFGLINEQQQTKKLEKPHRLIETKRDIARIKTLLCQRREQEKVEGTAK